VLYDKQHLVMGGGKRQLRLQDLVELEIAGIRYFFGLTHLVRVLRRVDDIFGRAIPAQPWLRESVAGDVLSLKGSIFAVNQDFHGIVSKNAHTRPQIGSWLFQEQAFAWLIRELAFEHSCSMIRHVVWF
jgi:hypothetical protein